VKSRPWHYVRSVDNRDQSLLCVAAAYGVMTFTAGDVSRAALKSAVALLKGRVRDRFREFLVPAFDAVLEMSSSEQQRSLEHLREVGMQECLAASSLSRLSANETKSRGVTYTPENLARFIVSDAIRHWRRQNPTSKGPKRVGDLSVGVGVFLKQLHDQGLGVGTDVIGVDVDRYSILCCEIMRVTLGASWELYCMDSLTTSLDMPKLSFEGQPFDLGSFDLLIGNPPYVRSANLARSYADEVRSNCRLIASSSFDLSIAFLEQGARLLSPRGVLSYITSSKFASTKYGETLCEYLAKERRVIAISDFGDEQVFPSVTTYVMILTIANSPPQKRFTYRSLSVSDMATTALNASATTLAVADSLNFPWTFISDELSGIRQKLTSRSAPMLSEVFPSIFQGVRTGANPVFVKALNDCLDFESELLLPFVSGRDIKRQKLAVPEMRLLFPYHVDEFRNAKLLSESSLRENFPRIYSYLAEHRSSLSDRSSENDDAWFAFARSQNLTSYLRPKVFVKEMMPRSEFAYDANGGMAFSSGYALDASHLSRKELARWTAILNTPTLEFSLRLVGTQLHSGWFRVLKHQLTRLRLPKISNADASAIDKLVVRLERTKSAKLSQELIEDIDEVVANAFELTDEDRKRIGDRLRLSHAKSMHGASSTSESSAKEFVAVNNYEPVRLEGYDSLHRERFDLQHLVTFRKAKGSPIHSWYPYTQGFDEALVRNLVDEMQLKSGSIVLDPFGGVGTTGIACRKLGMRSVVVDVSPLTSWIAKTKTSNLMYRDVEDLANSDALKLAESYHVVSGKSSELFGDFFREAYAPEILDKVRRILGYVDHEIKDPNLSDLVRLILLGKLEGLSNIRKHGSHYRFLNSDTSVGLEKLNIPIVEPSISVGQVLMQGLLEAGLHLREAEFQSPADWVKVLCGDARDLGVRDGSIDAVITSPPYLNRNNYIAQQKAELALLGLVTDSIAYKKLVRSTLASHVEGTLPVEAVSEIPEVNEILRHIKLEDGNNPKIPNMIAGYFNDMARVLREIWRVTVPGAQSAMVVGNTRWGGVVIPVDHLLMLEAERIGFKPQRILVTRYKGNSPQQMRRYGRIPVRESILIFSRP